MAYGTLRAKFYNTSYTLTGTINDVVDAASGEHRKNKPARNCFVKLPHQISPTERAYIVEGGLCAVELDIVNSSGSVTGTVPITCFVVKDTVIEGQGSNTFLRVSGDDKLSILEKWLGIIYLTHQETGTATATSINTITLAAGTADRTGWTVGAPSDPTQQVIIESHDTGTQVATLVQDWPLGAPSATTTYILHQALASTNELSRIRNEIEPFVSGGWTLNVENSYAGTENGTYNVIKQESALKTLQLVQEQAQGEYLILDNPFDTSLVVKWWRDPPASGVTFTHDKSLANNASYGLILPNTMRATKKDRTWTRVFPTGSGFGANALSLSAATISPSSLYSGFSLVTVGESVGIKNGNIDSSSFQRAAQKVFPEIQAANDVATQNTAAANGLMRAAAYWLNQNQGVEWEYRFSCFTTADLRAGQTCNLSWTDPGKNARTLSATGLYIQSVKRRVVNGQLITDVYLTETLEPSETAQEANDRHIASSQTAMRRNNATAGTAAAGGGAIGAHDHAYLPLSGGAMTGPVTTNSTFDGRDVSADGATLDAIPSTYVPLTRQIATTSPLTGGGALSSNLTLGLTLTASDVPAHDIITKHTYSGGAALDVVGLSAPSTPAMLTPSSDVSAGVSALLKSNTEGDLKLRRADVSERYELAGNHILSLSGTALFVGDSNGLATITSGFGIVAIGDQAAGNVTSGNGLLAIGAYALNAITTQASVVGIGASAGQFATGSQSIYIGAQAGYRQAGVKVIAIGDGAASGSTSTVTANSIVAIGTDAAKFFNGSNLVAIGDLAARVATGTGNSTTIGAQAATAATNVTDSTVIGSLASGQSTSVNTTVSIGSVANYLHTGSMTGSVFIGAYAGYFETNNYRLHISSSPTTNPLIYGEFNNHLVRLAAYSIEIGDGTNATTLTARTNDLTINVEGGDLKFATGTDLSGANWTSGFLGNEWGIDTGAGHADFRSVYADELRVTAFIAEGAFVRAGSQYITPSMATLSRDFVVPAASSTATLYVEDTNGIPDTAVFQDDDYVLLRIFDRSGGGLVAANIWGQVESYTDLGGGEQSWTFTSLSLGSGAQGATVSSGAVVLDFGQSGDGYIVSTTMDAAGSPYERISTWRGNPYTSANRSVHAQWGNLDGLAGTNREYGFYAGLSPSSARFVATDTQVGLHSVPLSLYTGGSNANLLLFSVKLITNLQSDRRPDGDISSSNTISTGGSNYGEIDNDSTSSYVANAGNSSNAEVWLDLESITTGMSEISIRSQAYITTSTTDGVVLTAQIFKSDGTTELTDEIMLANQTYDSGTSQFITKPFGYFDSSASQSDWNSARLRLAWNYYPSSSAAEVIRLDPFTPSIAVGSPLPTAVDIGDGVWMGRHSATGTYRFRVGKAAGPKLLWDASNLKLFNASNQETLTFAASGNGYISGVLELGASGGIFQGTGSFATPTTGLKMSNSGGIGRLQGYNSGTLQVEFGTDGKLAAGGGVAILDENGVSVITSITYSDTRAYRLIDSSGNLIGTLDGQVPNPALSNNIRLKVRETTGRDSNLYLESEAPSGENASVRLSAVIGNDDPVRLEVHHDRIEVDGHFNLQPQSATPTAPTTSTDGNLYVTNGKLVVQYNDAGTTRYKYIDLTGTGVTWTHTTTAP